MKGADWEVAPVWSRSSSPRLVPEGSVTSQVNEVPFKPDQEKRAGEEGLLPGTTLCTSTMDQSSGQWVTRENQPRRRVLGREGSTLCYRGGGKMHRKLTRAALRIPSNEERLAFNDARPVTHGRGGPKVSA